MQPKSFRQNLTSSATGRKMLELPIQRTELGHRYYTEEDIQTFQNIKELKERGFQLKAIKVLRRSLRNEKQILLLRSSIWSRNGRAGEGESGARGKYHSLPVESGSGQVSAV